MSDTSQQSVSRGVRRRLAQIALMLLIMGLAVFLPAGTLRWTWGRVYIGLYIGGILILGVFMLRTGWEIMARRSETAGMKDWDNTLREELPGYNDYTKDVPYRLVPGIW